MTAKRQPDELCNGTNACPSGKVAYLTRRAAKTWLAASRWPDHMRPYRCDQCGFWHIGHLPRSVLKGTATASEIYGVRP